MRQVPLLFTLRGFGIFVDLLRGSEVFVDFAYQ
jgi:hypothetical protein